MLKNKEIEKKKKKLLSTFNKLIKKSTVKAREGWEKFYVLKTGAVGIRCQAKKANSDPPKQCKFKAMKGRVVCRTHGGRGLSKRMKEIGVKKQELGLYNLKQSRAMTSELQEIEEVSEEKLYGVQDELKLSIATLRKYLKETQDIRIVEKPGKLMWLINNVISFKRQHWEMKHAPNVSFTPEQVGYLFTRIRTVIIEVIKDSEQIRKISDKIQRVGIELREEGFKVIKK